MKLHRRPRTGFRARILQWRHEGFDGLEDGEGLCQAAFYLNKILIKKGHPNDKRLCRFLFVDLYSRGR